MKDQLIEPPKKLKSKVRGVPGGPDPEILEKVNKRIEAVGRSYTQWALKDVERLSNLLRDLTPHQPAASKILDQMFQIALEMRGQGGSFSYPLISEAAKSLCIFIDALKKINEFDDTAKELCKVHSDTIKLILQKPPEDQNNTVDRQVVAGLSKATQIYAERRNLTLCY
ncbi:MAG: hypothetical protein AB8B77_08115 [Alphaproteobacteria bacterium]